MQDPHLEDRKCVVQPNSRYILLIGVELSKADMILEDDSIRSGLILLQSQVEDVQWETGMLRSRYKHQSRAGIIRHEEGSQVSYNRVLQRISESASGAGSLFNHNGAPVLQPGDDVMTFLQATRKKGNVVIDWMKKKELSKEQIRLRATIERLLKHVKSLTDVLPDNLHQVGIHQRSRCKPCKSDISARHLIQGTSSRTRSRRLSRWVSYHTDS